MNTKELKSTLLLHCETIVNQRMQKVQQTIDGIVESLDDESKSSAGDKHETGRAMLQIDRENAGKQLREIEQLKQLLRRIDITQTADYVRLGSLVYTSAGTFFYKSLCRFCNGGFICLYLCCIKSPIGNVIFRKKER